LPFDPPLTVEEVQLEFVNRFALQETIATGGQGAVFRASTISEDSNAPSTAVALKIYFEEQVEERTIREINALRQIESRTIV
jgi:hypothetical protein